MAGDCSLSTSSVDIKIRHATLFERITQPWAKARDVVKEVCTPIIVRPGLDVDWNLLRVGSVGRNAKGNVFARGRHNPDSHAMCASDDILKAYVQAKCDDLKASGVMCCSRLR